jgi:hypothetical protein
LLRCSNDEPSCSSALTSCSSADERDHRTGVTGKAVASQ